MRRFFHLGVLSILNIGILFSFQFYLIYKLGAGELTDAYFAGMTLPSVVITIVGTSLTHVLVPFLAGESNEKMHEDAWVFFYLIAALFILLAGILFFTASYWVPIILPGFKKISKELVIEITRMQLMAMIFIAINSIQSALCRVKQKFVWLESTALLSNIASILMLIITLPLYGIISAAWINIFQAFLQTLMLLPVMGKPRIPNVSSESMRVFLRRIYPLILGNFYFKSDMFVDRFLLSTTQSGTLSLYFFVQQIYGAFSILINRTLVGPMVPMLSEMYKKGHFVALRKLYYESFMRVFFLSGLTFIVIVFFGKRILDFLIGYGGVTEANIDTLWWLMIFLVGTLIAGVLSTITTSTYYASHDTATPSKIAAIVYTPYVILKVIIFKIFGVPGLAIITSIYCVINLLLQMIFLKKMMKVNFSVSGTRSVGEFE